MGRITGRVLNASTNQYLFNAEVRLEGSAAIVYTETDGSFRLSPVPAGPATIAVAYPGYGARRSTVTIGAGETRVVDFELAPLADAASPGTAGSLTVLDRFVVSAEIEGNAKALADQRASMNMRNVVASDNFGPVAEGNVAEFMKFIPGVVIDYADTQARSVRLAGLDAKYAGVTLDGMSMASAQSAGFSADTRRFEMEQVSGSSIEAVEVNKTLTAEMDASSPAGAINLRSKNAFERKGRRILYQLSGVAESYSLKFGRTPGPEDNERTVKIKPAVLLDYSDVFFNRRLGVQVSASDFWTYDEGFFAQTIYNYAVPAQPVVQRIFVRSNLQWTQRSSFAINADFKASDKLTLSLRSAGSYLYDPFTNREFHLNVARNDVLPGSTLTSVVTRPNGANTTFNFSGNKQSKYNNTITYSPRFRYKGEAFTLTGSAGYSRSFTHYESIQDGFFSAANQRITSMSWAAERDSERTHAWNVRQLSGRPWNDPASFNRDTTFSNNVIAGGRSGRNQRFIGALDFVKPLVARWPVELKTGLKSQIVTHSLYSGGDQQYTYLGPRGVQTSPEAALPMERILVFEANAGGNTNNLGWMSPSRTDLYNIYREHPGYFAQNDFANFQRVFLYPRTIQEQIDAAYAAGEVRFGRLRSQLGLRHERTRTAGKTWDPIPAAQIRRDRPDLTANTLPYLLYQYHDGVRATRYGRYGNWFLSGSAKYPITPKLDAQVSFSEAILRPDYNNLAGASSINETTLTATVPNSELKPEQTWKYFAGLQYYFQPAAVFSVGVYAITIRDKQLTGQTVPRSEVGSYADDLEYENYRFVSAINDPDRRLTKGIEVEYNQRLTFLPGPLKNLSVFGNVSRVIADEFTLQLVPKSAAGGISFKQGRFEGQVRTSWNAARPVSDSEFETIWMRERTSIDVNLGWQAWRGMQVFVSGRNITREPWGYYSNEPGRTTRLNRFGAQFTFGIKGTL
ncbi:MAG: hypothetical protein RIR76_502 [Verrucomicrobiota bacterium]